MKIKLLALILISLCFSPSFSQSFKFGIKGGANINKLTGKSFSEQFSFGYHLGGFAEIGITKKWAIQPEVLFNQSTVDTSSKFSAIYQFNKINNIKLKYLSIPLLLNFRPNKLITLQAGPQYAILMNQGSTLLQNGKAAFKNGDFSMLAGLQLKVLNFKFYGRYAVGLNNINDIDNKEKWKNQTIQLGLGVAF